MSQRGYVSVQSEISQDITIWVNGSVSKPSNSRRNQWKCVPEEQQAADVAPEGPGPDLGVQTGD